jgi:hypothetical protein
MLCGMAGWCFVVAVLDVSRWLAARLSVGNVSLQTFCMGKRPSRHVLCRSGAVDKVNGWIRPCVVRIRYARGSHHHLFCLVDALSRPAVGGAHALGFDSIAALLGRLFLRPVLIIVTNSFDRAPETADCLAVGLPSCATRTLDSQL